MSERFSLNEGISTYENFGDLTGALPADRLYRAGLYHGRHGELELSSDGAWIFRPGQHAPVSNLRPGASLSEQLMIADADGNVAVLTLAFTGAARASSEAVLREDLDADSKGRLVASGELEAGSYVAAKGTSPLLKGSFSVDAAGLWSWSLDGRTSKIQSLAAGQTLVDSFSVKLASGSTDTVSLLIEGRNDAAVIKTPSLGRLAEDRSVKISSDYGFEAGTSALITSGSLSVSDADLGEARLLGFGPSPVYVEAELGVFKLSTSGSKFLWSYAVRNSDVQALNSGESIADSILVRSFDASASSILTVVISGANEADKPDATFSGDLTGSVTEDADVANGFLLASGSVSVNDLDEAEDGFRQQSLKGRYGSLAVDAEGNWTYAADAYGSSLQRLKEASTLSDSFTLRSLDGSSVKLVMRLHGASNDTLGGLSGSVDEDRAGTLKGQLVHLDTGKAIAAVAAEYSGLYGRLKIDAKGAWSWTLSAEEEIQSVAEGESVTDSFVVSTLEGDKFIDIVIRGDDDAALITGELSLSVAADDTLSSSLGVVDVDSESPDFTAGQSSGLFGEFEILADGSWSYAPGAGSISLRDGETAVDSFAVSAGEASATLSIKLFGVNDFASIDGELGGQLTAWSQQTQASGSVTVSDPDSGESLVLAAQIAGDYGSFSINAAGLWVYTLNTQLYSVKSLPVGQSLDEEFTIVSFDSSATQTVSVSIAGAYDGSQTLDTPNSAPVLNWKPFIVGPDQNLFLSSAHLAAEDVDAADDAAHLVYTWASDNDSGITFLKNTVAVSSFTQEDVDLGRISIQAGRSDTRYVQMTVTDGSGAAIHRDISFFEAGALSQPDSWTDSDPSNGITLKYFFLTGVPAYYTGSDKTKVSNGFTAFTQAEKDAALSVMAQVESLTGIDFVEASSLSDSQIAYGNCESSDGAAAFAYFPPSDRTQKSSMDGDFWFDVTPSDALGNPIDLDLTPGSYSYSVFLHELGHALGLPHPYDDSGVAPESDSRYSLMSYNDHPNADVVSSVGDSISWEPAAPSGFMIHDIARLQQLYGADSGTRSGDTVYTAAELFNQLITIYDAGGEDSFDLSSLDQAVVLDLREGRLSSIWDDDFPAWAFEGDNSIPEALDPGTETLGIAFGTVIENAVGTAFDDFITGNSAANHIQAGDGKDQIDGQGGADSLDAGGGDDLILLDDAGFLSLDGGLGDDRVAWHGAFWHLGSNVSGIETFDLLGDTAAQTLRLGAATEGLLSGAVTRIMGDEHDTLILDSFSWTRSALSSEVFEAAVYDTWENPDWGATLMVAQQVLVV
ncbi:MAG: hypothetical protein RL095_3270 [Verrucomicrobiota bacterium]|jgi:VCBS repeat-containing protein